MHFLCETSCPPRTVHLHQALKVCWAAQRAQEENLIIGAIDKWLKLVFLTISFYGHV